MYGFEVSINDSTENIEENSVPKYENLVKDHQSEEYRTLLMSEIEKLRVRVL